MKEPRRNRQARTPPDGQCGANRESDASVHPFGEPARRNLERHHCARVEAAERRCLWIWLSQSEPGRGRRLSRGRSAGRQVTPAAGAFSRSYYNEDSFVSNSDPIRLLDKNITHLVGGSKEDSLFP
jgi:hypothetical protein